MGRRACLLPFAFCLLPSAFCLSTVAFVSALFPPATAQAQEIRVSLSAGTAQPGDLVLLTADAPTAVDSLTVQAFGRDVRAFRTDSRTWQALVGVDLADPPREYRVTATARAGERTISATAPLVVQPRNFPTRRLHVDPSFVEPPPAAVERIGREAEELTAVWGDTSATRLWHAAFVQPVNEASTGRFGARSVFNGALRAPHAGEDFASPEGTFVQAPNTGRVVLAHDLYFTGNTIVIDHGLGLFSLLAHLSSFDVNLGDMVAVGQRLGSSGATGRVTGPHLHWAVRAAGARVDPQSLLSLLGPHGTAGAVPR